MLSLGGIARRASRTLAATSTSTTTSTSTPHPHLPIHSPAAASAPARLFSTTPAAQTKTIHLTRIPEPLVPPYPPGPYPFFKQANRGLYANQRKQYGNRVSEHQNKTRRSWSPNVHRIKLWSDALKCNVKARMTMRAYRTLKKEGGLDNYVLKPTDRRVRELGPSGWKLRWLVMQTPSVRQRLRDERAALGVPEENLDRGDDAIAREDVQISLDAATPGKLSASTRAILARREEEARRLAEGEEFVLGEEAEGVEEAEMLAAEGEGENVSERVEVWGQRGSTAAEGDADMAKRMGWKS